MQSKRVLPPETRGDHHHPHPMAPFGPASPLLSPTIRGDALVGDQCTLRPPCLAGNATSASFSSSSPLSPPEDIPRDVPLVADLMKLRQLPLPELIFRGWKKPVKEWKAWAEAMAREDKFVRVWRAAGVEDAILNSTVNIRPDKQMILALVAFWCRSTCTFVLPWGEVGFTLEDAYILGNLPVWGSPLQRLLTEEEKRLSSRLVEVKEGLLKMMKNSGQRPRVTHSFWLNWFVKLEGDDELLHLGFLAYWLSRFVVPSKSLHEVPSVVFGVAARLSRGERIALAPAVTANLYSDLSIITKLLNDSQGGNAVANIEVWGQFCLLQTWLWERFGCLSPLGHNSINQQPRVRIARWDNKHNRLMYCVAHKALCDPQSFSWRPYTIELGNWVKPEWYTKGGKNIAVDEHSPIWVYDILAIVSAAGLVGFATEDTIPMAQYKPYRVSMQLGYDQAIPTSTGPLVMPWDSSTMCPVGIEFYIPSMARKCSTLKGYDEWWKDYTVSYAMVQKVSESDLNEKTKNKRKMNDANNKDISKKISMDGNMKNEFPGNTKVGNERGHQKGEPSFAEKPTNTSRKPDVVVLDDDVAPDVIIIEDDQDKDMKQKDWEHGPQSHEGCEDKPDFDDVLVDELEEFLTQGLQSELLSNVSSQRSSEISTEDDHRNRTDATVVGDRIGEEVIMKYPKFFNLIPQCPHYIGLLQSSVDAITKNIVYTFLWYKLVELMQKAIMTTCQTKASEIEQLTKEACTLGKLGFDVRHLIARLRQPGKRLKEMELANATLEKARKRLKEAEKQSCLGDVSRTHTSNLLKAVKEAETNVLEREWDVEILGKHLNSK